MDAMRKFLSNASLAALLVSTTVGCLHRTPVSVTPPKTVLLDEPVTLTLGQSVRYADGLDVRLEKIDDSRCPPKNVCVWEGELAPILRLGGGDVGSERELRLGTARGREGKLSGYVIALVEATPTTATITITRAAGAKNGCRKTGCSGEICSAEEIASTCMYRAEFACYKTATCERQADGKCGWTRTPALDHCLADPPRTD